MVPESGEVISVFLGRPTEEVITGEIEWFDLYDFLSGVAYRGIILPELRRQVRNAELLSRCFEFVELLLMSPVDSIHAAAYFEVIEPLLGDEQLVVASLPLLGEEAARLMLSELDATRVSDATRKAIAEYL